MSRTLELTRRTGLILTAGAALIGPASTAASTTTDRETMESVTGIGGFFFRAKEPDKLAKWYQDHLGVTMTPKSYGGTAWRQEAGTTVFAPFKQDTTYFGDMRLQWMINFRVRDLDKMAAQLRAAGAKVEIDPETYPNGRFAQTADPEGNPIQLWQPGGVDKS
jgi:glyoxylase I family protein